jgi:hydrophobe/amphiphile efflux-3 (HAE3) family protein
MRAAARRPLAAGLIVAALALTGAAFALRLHPSARTDTLVGRSSDAYGATTALHARFGDDPVIVLIRGDLRRTVLTDDLERVVGLEGCISGRVPAGVTPRGGTNGPCAKLSRLNPRPVKVVYGPGTFINESAGQIADAFTNTRNQKSVEAEQAGQAAYKVARSRGYSVKRAKRFQSEARALVYNEFLRDSFKLALQYKLSDIPKINDPNFVSTLVFENVTHPCKPKARFAYLFPTCDSALIQARLRPDLSDTQRTQAIGLIRQAVRMPDWRLRGGQQYVVTGAPVVVSDLSDTLVSSVKTLLIAALLVMALMLALVFRVRMRLLPLAIAVAALAITFGALSAAGASLTMASIGVLPVLLGLAVDYAIQLQSRVLEERGDLERVARLGAPTIATAAAATAAGFLVLLVSPVPMVRGFGVLLVIGIAVAFTCALTAGIAALTSRARMPRPLEAVRGALAPATRGAGDLLRDNPVARWARGRGERGWRGALGLATRSPAAVLGTAIVLAAAGWGLDTQTKVESDVNKLVPQNLGALQDLQALQKSTGVGGEIDVLVRADDLTDPKVVQWMSGYQGRLVKRFGYSATRGCGKAELCPAFSLPDLFRGGTANSSSTIKALLDAVPAYFSQGVITGDRTVATLAFGIRLMPLDRQEQVIRTMRSELHPPAGVSARLAGLPVLAAEANDRVSSPWRRYLMLALGLIAVALVLLVALRSRTRAFVPLIPIALATGWSALVLFALRIPLNPMSVTLGAMVIAISTEFSVLLSERYRQERLAGHEATEALQRTYRSTGAAVMASGATAIAGFAVLIVSDIRMLRQFGEVTVVDLTVALVGVLVVLPAVLVLAERRAAGEPVAVRPKLPRLRPRLRRAEG